MVHDHFTEEMLANPLLVVAGNLIVKGYGETCSLEESKEKLCNKYHTVLTLSPNIFAPLCTRATRKRGSLFRRIAELLTEMFDISQLMPAAPAISRLPMPLSQVTMLAARAMSRLAGGGRLAAAVRVLWLPQARPLAARLEGAGLRVELRPRAQRQPAVRVWHSGPVVLPVQRRQGRRAARRPSAPRAGCRRRRRRRGAARLRSGAPRAAPPVLLRRSCSTYLGLDGLLRAPVCL